MSLKNYLEMIPVKEFRQKMADAGLQANTVETSNDIDVPDWLLDDAGCILDKARQQLGPNVKKGLLNKLSEFIFDTPAPLRRDNLRLIITIDGKILWGQASDVIHQNIIAYGMCKGYIPMEEKLSDYKWQDDFTLMNYFICLHYDRGDPDYPCSFAESYYSDAKRQIAYRLSDNLDQYSGYFKAFRSMKIDVEDIN